MVKYIILALLLALGIVLYVKRDAVMSVMRGEKSVTQEMQETMAEMKQRAENVKDAMMGEDGETVEMEEVEIAE